MHILRELYDTIVTPIILKCLLVVATLTAITLVAYNLN